MLHSIVYVQLHKYSVCTLYLLYVIYNHYLCKYKHTFADENECKYRPCDIFAHCTNTLGSFQCSCFPGYQGDGFHCEGMRVIFFHSLSFYFYLIFSFDACLQISMSVIIRYLPRDASRTPSVAIFHRTSYANANLATSATARCIARM